MKILSHLLSETYCGSRWTVDGKIIKTKIQECLTESWNKHTKCLLCYSLGTQLYEWVSFTFKELITSVIQWGRWHVKEALKLQVDFLKQQNWGRSFHTSEMSKQKFNIWQVVMYFVTHHRRPFLLFCSKVTSMYFLQIE